MHTLVKSAFLGVFFQVRKDGVDQRKANILVRKTSKTQSDETYKEN